MQAQQSGALPGVKPKSDGRRIFYVIDIVLLVCLQVASVLPVFSFKANGVVVQLHWFQADAT